MPIYNLIEYSGNYLKTSGICKHLQHWRDQPAVNNDAINDFIVANSITDSLKNEEEMTGHTGSYEPKKLN